MSSQQTIIIDPGSFVLEDLFSDVESMAEEGKWPEALVFKVNLVLEELVINTLSHGRHENLEAVHITLAYEPDALTIEITDNGRPFNPLEDVLKPDVNAALEERSIGGLGVHLVTTMMDEMKYKRVDGKNRLTLVTHAVG